jgi:hypothetical protein
MQTKDGLARRAKTAHLAEMDRVGTLEYMDVNVGGFWTFGAVGASLRDRAVSKHRCGSSSIGYYGAQGHCTRLKY